MQNQNNWGLSYQLDTLWTDAWFGYVRGSVAHDDFAGFETDAFAGIGAGAYLVQSDAVTLRSEVGPGYRYLDIAGEDRRVHAIGLYGSAELDWQLEPSRADRPPERAHRSASVRQRRAERGRHE